MTGEPAETRKHRGGPAARFGEAEKHMQLPRGEPIHVRSNHDRSRARTVLDLPGRGARRRRAGELSLQESWRRKLAVIGAALALAGLSALVLSGILMGVIAWRPW